VVDSYTYALARGHHVEDLPRAGRLQIAFSTPATGRADWREVAVCSSADPEVFWPAKGEVPRAALALCVGCPVVGDCRESFRRSALPDAGGVWFATTERERFRHRRLQRMGEAAA